MGGGEFGNFTVAFIFDEGDGVGEKSPVDIHGGEFSFGFGVAEVINQATVGTGSGGNNWVEPT